MIHKGHVTLDVINLIWFMKSDIYKPTFHGTETDAKSKYEATLSNI